MLCEHCSGQKSSLPPTQPVGFAGVLVHPSQCVALKILKFVTLTKAGIL